MSEVQNHNIEESSEQDMNILKKIRLEKLDELKANNADPYEITSYDVTANNADLKSSYETEEAELKASAGDDEEAFTAGLEKIKERTVTIAGRIMSWRDMGKANFIDVRDDSDRNRGSLASRLQ